MNNISKIQLNMVLGYGRKFSTEELIGFLQVSESTDENILIAMEELSNKLGCSDNPILASKGIMEQQENDYDLLSKIPNELFVVEYFECLFSEIINNEDVVVNTIYESFEDSKENLYVFLPNVSPVEAKPLEEIEILIKEINNILYDYIGIPIKNFEDVYDFEIKS